MWHRHEIGILKLFRQTRCMRTSQVPVLGTFDQLALSMAPPGQCPMRRKTGLGVAWSPLAMDKG